jgi:hypothetical protein
VGLEVLRALLKRTNWTSGLCFPSYLTLQLMTGCCRAAVAAALRRLNVRSVLQQQRTGVKIMTTQAKPSSGRNHHGMTRGNVVMIGIYQSLRKIDAVPSSTRAMIAKRRAR